MSLMGKPIGGGMSLRHAPDLDDESTATPESAPEAAPPPRPRQRTVVTLDREATVLTQYPSARSPLPFRQAPPAMSPASGPPSSEAVKPALTPMFGAPPAFGQPPTFSPSRASWPPPPMPPPAPAPVMSAPPATTIGQQLAYGAKAESTGHAESAYAVPSWQVPAPPPEPRADARPPLELLWWSEDPVRKAELGPVVAAALGAASEGQEITRRAVHRTLARSTPLEDVEGALFDAVEEDGILTPPLAVIAGEIELVVEDAELLKTLATLARPFTEGNGQIEARLDDAVAVADRLPGAVGLLARELAALHVAWAEAVLTMPLEVLEAEAVQILVHARRFRTLRVFQSDHVVGLLRTRAHEGPLPVYLPATAQDYLPLESRFDARLLVELRPRQVAGEASVVAAAVLAIAREIHRRPT